MLLFLWGWLVASGSSLAWAEGEEDPLWNRPSFEKKVFRVAQRIITANGIPERIEFLTSQLDIRNASARRFGGPNTVVIYKDMLDVMESDDELAAVLSHEIAHITRRHTGIIVPKKWAAKTALWTAYTVGGTAASLATAGLAAPVFIVGAAGIKKMNQSGIALTGPISRPYEKEADLVGLDYMVKAGYNPLAMESLLLKGVGDAGPVANFFASHPGGSERLAYIHEAIQSRYPQYLGNKSPLPASVGKEAPRSEDHSAVVDAALVDGSGASDKPSSSESALANATPSSKQASERANSLQPAPLASLAPSKVQAEKAESAKHGAAVPMAQVVAQQSTVAATSGALSTTSPAKVLFAKPLLPVTAQTAPDVSVAQVLLSLQPDQLRILRMLSQRGYLSRQELRTQMEYVGPELLTHQINELIQKRLIRLLGAEPDEVIVLSDWATEALKPESSP